MKKNEFDQFSEKCDEILSDSVPDSLSENPYFAEYKINLVSRLLSNDKPKRILDFGRSPRRGLPYLQKYFPDAEICGLDVTTASLDIAKHKVPEASLISGWNKIKNNSFYLIVAANVFHHIQPEERVEALSKCYEVLECSGVMFVFEHNLYNPATRWVFERCPFDVDAEMLSLSEALSLSKREKFKTIDHGYTLFFSAPLTYFRKFESALKSIPVSAQYYV